MNARARQEIIRNTFLCGLATFLVTSFFTLVGDIPLILISTNVLPGFVFGFILSIGDEKLPAWRRVLFVCCSGGLFVLAAWLATNRHFSIHGQWTFILSSLAGANALLILYHLLLRKPLIIWKGSLLATIMGIVTAYFPAKAYWDDDYTTSIGELYNTVILMSIFLTWQTFFGMTVALSSPVAANGVLLQWGLRNKF